MDKQKAEELQKLTKDFTEKFQQIANGDKDVALILEARVKTNDTTLDATVVLGTVFQTMMAMHELDKQTPIVQDYALSRAAIEIDHMMDDMLSKRGHQPNGEQQPHDEPSGSEDVPGDTPSGDDAEDE